MKILDWNKDKWFSRNGSIIPFDKLEHFLLGLIGMIAGISLLGFSAITTFIFLELVAIGWEMKDGIVPAKGYIEGFSLKDLFADNLGFLAGYLLILLF
ncbi:MAG: hypothetical protein ACE5GL_10325 [Calditrichia bacterium]